MSNKRINDELYLAALVQALRANRKGLSKKGSETSDLRQRQLHDLFSYVNIIFSFDERIEMRHQARCYLY